MLSPPAKTRRLATLSLALAVVPVALAGLAIIYCFQQPPPLSGFEGVGWFLGMTALLGVLAVATYVAAPLSIVSGLWALHRLQGAAPQPGGRRRTWAGIVISILVLVAVVSGHVIGNRRFTRANASNQSQLQAMAGRRAPEERVTRLVRACREYAHVNEGHYPADLHELRIWCGQNGRWSDDLRSDEFAYLGAGADDMTMRKLTADEIGQVGRLLLFVQRNASADGFRVIGLAGSSAYSASALTIADSKLPAYLRASNDERRRRGLAPADFESPASRPAAGSGN